MTLKATAGLLVTGLVLLWTAGLGVRSATAQAQVGQTPPSDPYQRSFDNFTFTATATRGAQRGEELYYYKCWFCHNQFAKRAPDLKDIFMRPNVTDQTIGDKIRNGGPGMPSYRTTFSDADLADVISYLKEKCCWEGEEPPPNPRYRAGAAR